jgi:hypothetical protein
MSDMGEMWSEQREKLRAKKSSLLKWNTDVMYGMQVEFDNYFEIKKHTDFHYSLIHPIRGRMDCWPSTGKVSWFNDNRKKRKVYVIKDLEAYLIQNFKP